MTFVKELCKLAVPRQSINSISLLTKIIKSAQCQWCSIYCSGDVRLPCCYTKEFQNVWCAVLHHCWNPPSATSSTIEQMWLLKVSEGRTTIEIDNDLLVCGTTETAWESRSWDKSIESRTLTPARGQLHYCQHWLPSRWGQFFCDGIEGHVLKDQHATDVFQQAVKRADTGTRARRLWQLEELCVICMQFSLGTSCMSWVDHNGRKHILLHAARVKANIAWNQLCSFRGIICAPTLPIVMIRWAIRIAIIIASIPEKSSAPVSELLKAFTYWLE